MKFLRVRNNLLKSILILSLFFVLISSVITEKQAPKVNVYKTDKSVKHSLFKEKNDIDRISISHDGVPPKKE
jgi:hypothetical protein